MTNSSNGAADSGRPATLDTNPPSGKRKIGLIVAWALSLAVAFLLGMASRPATPVAEPAASTQPSAATSTAASEQPSAQAQPSQDAKMIEFLKSLPKRDANDRAAMGKVDAKVVLIEWSDYRCPFCALWAKQTLPQLQKYVDDGTLRIEYRDLAIFGEQSVNVAVAAHAAGLQGKFWEYQHAVYAAAPASGHPDIDQAKILAFAKTAGVPDVAKFQKDLADPKLTELVTSSTAEAQSLGINGTPFFVINTQVINGAHPAENFIAAIEAAKKEA